MISAAKECASDAGANSRFQCKSPEPMPYRIFLVEDHPIMRRTYAQVLKRETDFVLCGSVASAEEALIALADTTCDLLVTDMALPGMDGIELAERVRGLFPDLPTLVISAHSDEVFVQRAYRAGARAYLGKQNLAGTLIPTVRGILTDGHSLPGTPAD